MVLFAICGLNVMGAYCRRDGLKSRLLEDCSLRFENKAAGLCDICLLWTGVVVLDRKLARIYYHVTDTNCPPCAAEGRPNHWETCLQEVDEMFGTSRAAFARKTGGNCLLLTDLNSSEQTLQDRQCKQCSISVVESAKCIELFQQDAAYVLNKEGVVHKIESLLQGRGLVYHVGMPVRITSLSCGIEHGLFLGDGGRVFAVGSGSKGQTGLGTTDAATRPQEVTTLEPLKMVDVAAGGWHSVVLSGEH